MAQFDIYRNPDPISNPSAPYLPDVQADLLSQLSTRVVVPLIRQDAIVRAARLHPMFVIEGRPMVLATEDIAAIRRTDLGEFVSSLAERRWEIVAAIDFLIGGV